MGSEIWPLGTRRALCGNLVVVDCRVASSELFLDYFVEIDAPAVLKALGSALTLVMPVNHELDSVDQVRNLTDQLGKTCCYVVVRNAAHMKNDADELLP